MPRNPSSTIHRGEPVKLTVDRHTVHAFAGETLATVLLAEGITTFNRSANDQPRGPYCNMGTCFECQVRMAPAADGDFRWVRACMMTIRDGMIIKTGISLLSHPQVTAKPGSDSNESGN